MEEHSRRKDETLWCVHNREQNTKPNEEPPVPKIFNTELLELQALVINWINNTT